MLSELRRPKGDPGVRRAVDALESDDLFVSVLSVGTIAKGIALLKESKNKRNLEAWLQALERHYADRVLPVDLETSIFGESSQPLRRKPARPFLPVMDCLLPRHDAMGCTS